MLEIWGVSKSFGGLKALDSVDPVVGPAEIRGPDRAEWHGQVQAGAYHLGPTCPGQRRRAVGRARGVEPRSRTGGPRRNWPHLPELRLFPARTDLQNSEVAAQTARECRPDRAVAMDLHAGIAALGLAGADHLDAGTLSYGDQRRVEILRALALCPDFLLPDEPAAGMNEVETAILVTVIRSIRDRHGVGLIVIDHDLHFIMGLCERIAVLDMGRKIAEGTAQEVRHDPRGCGILDSGYPRLVWRGVRGAWRSFTEKGTWPIRAVPIIGFEDGQRVVVSYDTRGFLPHSK